MEFTDTKLEALFIAWTCAREGKGFVPTEDAEVSCEALARDGWLRTEKKENGDVAYFLMRRAETALEINGWLESTKGREN
jgi:hypothetical protein